MFKTGQQTTVWALWHCNYYVVPQTAHDNHEKKRESREKRKHKPKLDHENSSNKSAPDNDQRQDDEQSEDTAKKPKKKRKGKLERYPSLTASEIEAYRNMSPVSIIFSPPSSKASSKEKWTY